MQIVQLFLWGILNFQQMKVIIQILFLLICISCNSQTQNKTTNKMKIAVWDTYVTKKDGKVMHFDILAPEEITDASVIYNYGKEYIKAKGQEGQPLSAKECRFCHVETLRANWETDIKNKGYYIIEMENCN
jgi:hypothetical protein